MSCYTVDPAHIDLILTVATHHGAGIIRHLAHYPDAYDERSTLDALGTMLHAANVASVNDRYTEGHRADVLPYTFRAIYGTIPVVDALKAIDCLRYQSCDWSGWEVSEAKEALDAIEHSLVNKLPGYDEAPTWSFGESERRHYA